MELKTYPLTEDDFYLITKALRNYSENTGFGTIKDDCINLISYLEQEKINGTD